MARLTLQNEELKELVANCERTIAQKDSIIGNMTTSLNKQKTKEGLVRSFNQWKLRHCDEKREVGLFYIWYFRYLIIRKGCPLFHVLKLLSMLLKFRSALEVENDKQGYVYNCSNKEYP